MIQIYNPNINDYKKSAIEAIESGWISNHGIFIEKSTNKLKQTLNCENIILMSNGTCATHCLFISLKYKYPDIKKIYVPNNCYVAAWNCLFMEYEKSVVEVMKMDIDTWNINTSEEYIKGLERDAAVLIVHNLGNIVNVPRLKKIRPDLIFVEDCCEGLFGKYENIYVGTSDSSLCSSVSFYGNKIITTGEGGAFFTTDKDLYKYILKVYSQGMSETRYLHDTHAYNYRMTNIQAAFLYDQLNDLDNILHKKKQVFDNYEKLLIDEIENGKVKLYKKEDNIISANWIFAVRIVNNKLSIEEKFNFFKKNNIDTRPFFYPINNHYHLKDLIFEDDVPLLLNNEVLMIPSSPNITLIEQEKVVQSIKKYLILINNNIEIIDISQENKYLLKEFIKDIKSETFRYFNKRNEDVIIDHVLTILLKNNINEEIYGYAHIDFFDNKNWFGIYIKDEYQGKGIGKICLSYVINHYKIKKLDNIYLHVDKVNIIAKNLYNNFFKIKEEKENYYLMEKL